MKVIVLLGLIAAVFAQDAGPVDDGAIDEVAPELPSNDYVKTDAMWPENKDTNGGFLASFAYAGIEDGSCTFELPQAALLFHVLNGHIVPGDGTNPGEGLYKVAAPAGWEMENGTLRVLVYCARGGLFNATDVQFRCDPQDVAELSVYSFPQNDEIDEASSNVFYRPGYRKGDILTITLPNAVERFNITGGDSRWNIDYAGQTIRVAFSLQYLRDEDDPTSRANWFSAGSVSVTVGSEEDEEI